MEERVEQVAETVSNGTVPESQDTKKEDGSKVCQMKEDAGSIR